MAGRTHRETTLIGWGFIAAQFALLAVMVFLPRGVDYTPGPAARIVGAVAMGTGIAIGLWAALYLRRGLTPTPVPNGATDLVTKGPYRFARHPMYSAVVLLMAGIALRSGSWAVWAAFVGLVVLFHVKSRWEEARLRETFPGYERYLATTGRFGPLPGLAQRTDA